MIVFLLFSMDRDKGNIKERISGQVKSLIGSLGIDIYCLRDFICNLLYRLNSIILYNLPSLCVSAYHNVKASFCRAPTAW